MGKCLKAAEPQLLLLYNGTRESGQFAGWTVRIMDAKCLESKQRLKTSQSVVVMVVIVPLGKMV